MRKDDPRVAALMEQAKLLSSLAIRVNAESTEESLENAWKVRSSNNFTFLNPDAMEHQALRGQKEKENWT